MTLEAATQQAARFGREQKRSYSLHHRDFQLAGQAQRSLLSMNGYFLLLYADDQVTIDSNLGVYDRISSGIAECQHVHSGQISLANYDDTLRNVEFLQVVFDA